MYFTKFSDLGIAHAFISLPAVLFLSNVLCHPSMKQAVHKYIWGCCDNGLATLVFSVYSKVCIILDSSPLYCVIRRCTSRLEWLWCWLSLGQLADCLTCVQATGAIEVLPLHVLLVPALYFCFVIPP